MSAFVKIPYSLTVQHATVDRDEAMKAFATYGYHELNAIKERLQRARAFRSQLAPSALKELPPLLDFSNYDFSADARFHEHHVLKPSGLSGLDLSGVDFTDAKLAGLSLTDSIFDGANFKGANLMGTDFKRASLIGAMLKGAKYLHFAFDLDLTGSDLDPALKAAEAGRGLGARRQAPASTERHP